MPVVPGITAAEIRANFALFFANQPRALAIMNIISKIRIFLQR